MPVYNWYVCLRQHTEHGEELVEHHLQVSLMGLYTWLNMNVKEAEGWIIQWIILQPERRQ